MLSEHPSAGSRSDLTIGPVSRLSRSDAQDAFLASLLPSDVAEGGGVALVAVGGYGRREMAPGSDLDVVLLHDASLSQDAVSAIAEKIWYPVWDSGAKLDHSVRTVAEARELAGVELAVAAGLLDARLIVGDAALVRDLRAAVFGDWRREAARRLGDLRAEYEARRAAHGDLAFRLEGDLKESHGGLRDSVMLRFISASWLVDVPHGAPEVARAFLLDVRDALHTVSGRALDRLLLQEQDGVAARLRYEGFWEEPDFGAEAVLRRATGPGDDALVAAVALEVRRRGQYTTDADVLMRRVAEAAGTVSYAAESAWRQVDAALVARNPSRRPVRRPLADGVVEQDGEVYLARAAVPSRDPVLVLRAAAAAAASGLSFAPHTLRRLADESMAMPRPWPRAARESFVALLGSGAGLIPVWEALDRSGILASLLPEWQRVRSLPQRNSLHIHTVDRHSLETVVRSSAMIRRMARPDLLLVAALLHDIGKGLPGDHAEVGAVIAADLVSGLGFNERDAGVLAGLVRHHLLLPDLATHRDPDDPATLATLLTALADLPCPRLEALRLLLALTEADSQATGPAAWNPWRAGLYRELAARAEASLLGFDLPESEPSDASSAELAARCRASADGLVVELASAARSEATRSELAAPASGPDTAPSGTVVVEAAAPAPGPDPEPSGTVVVEAAAPAAPTTGSGTASLSIAVPDRIGVLAAVAGVLALRRVAIRAASTETVDGIAVQSWTVAASGLPDLPRLRTDLRTALEGTLDVRTRLAARDSSVRITQAVAPPSVTVLDGASASATVLEVKAHDRPGLLFQITASLAAEGVAVRSARVSTLGAEAVDVFYVVDALGSALPAERAERVAQSVLRVLEIA